MIAGVRIFDTIDNTRKRYAVIEKSNPVRFFCGNVFSLWDLFPATKNWHNRTTVSYTKYVRNTKNYFPPEPKN